MFSTLLTVTLFFALAAQTVFADFAVSTPEIFACKGRDLKVTWQAATAPYNVVVVGSDDPCGDALVDAGDFQTTYATFKTDQLKAGQKVEISIEDAHGEEGWSGVVTVQECPSSSTPSASSPAYATGAAVEAATTPVASSAAPYVFPSSPAAPIGAAKGDFDNAAISRHISIPAVALSAAVGAIAILL